MSRLSGLPKSVVRRLQAPAVPRWLRTAALALPVMLLAACVRGPDFVRPAAPASAPYSSAPIPGVSGATVIPGGTAQHFVQGLPVPGQWWKYFASPALDALVDQALLANPDLQAAQAALRLAQENVLAQEGLRVPTVQANFTASRQKNPTGTLSPSLSSGDALFNLHTAQVNVGYVPDVFGAIGRQTESLQAQAETQRFQLEATYLSLISNLLVAALDEAALRAQLDAAQALVRLQSTQLDLLRRQQSLGAIGGADVLAQQAALAQSQSALPALRKQLALQQHLLSALSGQVPEEASVTPFELTDFTLPEALPLSLPAQLVEQRPDVRAAEAQWHAASAAIGVASAYRLPQLLLGASLGGTATQIAQLLASGNTFWSLGGSVGQTVFDGGTLRHRERAAEAAYAQAGAQYRSTVITAFQNVADVLQALRQDAAALEASLRAERAAAASLELAQRTQQLGGSGALPVLLAEQALAQARTSRVLAQLGRYTDTVALFQALGGGWQDRDRRAADGADSLGKASQLP